MAGSGWQQLAASAKELAGQSAGKARAVTATLGKAVVSAAALVGHVPACCPRCINSLVMHSQPSALALVCL